jgi:dimethylamine monooxygenase subunit A
VSGDVGAFAHTPYDGSHKPFTIGMSLLDPREWIEVDGHIGRYLAEKDELFATSRDVVFREETETRAAQGEVLAMLADFLPQRFPGTYRRDGSRIEIVPLGRSIDLDGGEPPLMTASRFVQEDLCLMRDGPGGYRLAAASLCFPSSWSLAEKFGATLDGLHGNVPGYAGGFGPRMNRIFSNLRTELPAQRLNWSLYADDELHHPASKARPRHWFDAEAGDFGAFVRVERQTLRRLPVSGDILFTIRIYVDPVDAFRRHPDGARLAAGLRDDILRLDEAQLTYKALLEGRDRVASALGEIAGSNG